MPALIVCSGACGLGVATERPKLRLLPVDVAEGNGTGAAAKIAVRICSNEQMDETICLKEAAFCEYAPQA